MNPLHPLSQQAGITSPGGALLLSETIVLRGTLEMLRDNALNIKEAINRCVVEGWPVLQYDEIWLYETHPELAAVGVCDTCYDYNGREFGGNQVSSEFPYLFVNPLLIKPRVHERDGIHNFFNEPCHCTLKWLNPAECVENRLHNKKLEAIK